MLPHWQSENQILFQSIIIFLKQIMEHTYFQQRTRINFQLFLYQYQQKTKLLQTQRSSSVTIVSYPREPNALHRYRLSSQKHQKLQEMYTENYVESSSFLKKKVSNIIRFFEVFLLYSEKHRTNRPTTIRTTALRS